MAKRPFEYFDYDKRILLDLSIQEHRDLVVQRNKALFDAYTYGLPVSKVKVNIEVEVNLECLVCGCSIHADSKLKDFDIENNSEFDLCGEMPTVKCHRCETKYDYDDSDNTYNLTYKKDQKDADN